MSVPRGRRFSSRVPRDARTRHAASPLRQNLPCRSRPSRRPICTRAPEVPLRRSPGTGPSREATPLAIRSFASSRSDALTTPRTFSTPPEPGGPAHPCQARSKPMPLRLLVPGTPRDGHRHTARVRSPPRRTGSPSRAADTDGLPTGPTRPRTPGSFPASPSPDQRPPCDRRHSGQCPYPIRPLAHAGPGYRNHGVACRGWSCPHREQPRDRRLRPRTSRGSLARLTGRSSGPLGGAQRPLNANR
jgi:hypothetical protein